MNYPEKSGRCECGKPPVRVLGMFLALALTACGGGGPGGSNNNGDGGTIPPPPPPVIDSDDVFVGLLSGAPGRLPVLDNDRQGETIVYVSPGQVGSNIVIDGSAIRYTSPGNFVGEDSFYYLTESASGAQSRSEVALRVDQVSGHSNPIVTPAPAPLASTSQSDGPYEIGYELYANIELITRSTTILENDFNRSIRIDGVPSPLYDNDRAQAHVINTRLRKGVRYLIVVEYSMDREDEIIPPLIWSEVPQTVLTDTYSVPLYDDQCVFYEDWVNGNFWACHSNQFGTDRFGALVFEPRVTDDYNLYVTTEIYELDPKLTVLCEEVPNFGCAYNVLIEEIDDNTSSLLDASIAIGGSPVHGSIEEHDEEDWFVARAYATERTILNVHGEMDAHGNTLTDFVVQLWQGTRMIRSTTSANGVANIDYYATDDTTLKVRIQPLTSVKGGYRIESTGGDVPSDTDTYASLRVGEVVDGKINNGRDAGDWFKIYLDADVQYDASVTTSITDIENAFIGLRDARGDAILSSRQSADLSCDPGCEYTHSMSFSLPRAGYYFVTVAAPEPQQNGDYRVAVVRRQAPAPDDDFAGDPSTTGRAESMVPTLGVLELPGDSDWFRFISAFGGEQRTFFVDGAYIRNSIFEYPVVTVVDEHGMTVASGEIWTDGVQRVSFTATGPATYYLAVSADGLNALPYTVHNGPGDPAEDRNSRVYIGACSEVHQAIGRAADQDWYNIELLADTTYGFEVVGEDQGYTAATRPRVSLYTLEGDRLGTVTAQDDASALLTMAISESGQYFVAVNNDSGRIGGYRLAVTNLAAGACPD